MDQPTPAGSATARDVIARWMGNLGLTHEEKLLVADKLMAFLASAGYHVLTSEQLLMACSLHFMPRAETTIAAASEPAEGEGSE